MVSIIWVYWVNAFCELFYKLNLLFVVSVFHIAKVKLRGCDQCVEQVPQHVPCTDCTLWENRWTHRRFLDPLVKSCRLKRKFCSWSTNLNVQWPVAAIVWSSLTTLKPSVGPCALSTGTLVNNSPTVIWNQNSFLFYFLSFIKIEKCFEIFTWSVFWTIGSVSLTNIYCTKTEPTYNGTLPTTGFICGLLRKSIVVGRMLNVCFKKNFNGKIKSKKKHLTKLWMPHS